MDLKGKKGLNIGIRTDFTILDGVCEILRIVPICKEEQNGF